MTFAADTADDLSYQDDLESVVLTSGTGVTTTVVGVFMGAVTGKDVRRFDGIADIARCDKTFRMAVSNLSGVVPDVSFTVLRSSKRYQVDHVSKNQTDTEYLLFTHEVPNG